MSNYLSDPNLWTENGTVPPAGNWNGTAYTWASGVSEAIPAQLWSETPVPTPEDVVAGTIFFENLDGYSAYLIYALEGTTQYGNIPINSGEVTPFSFQAQQGAKLFIANSSEEDTFAAYYYGAEVVITPTAAPPVDEVNYNCECDEPTRNAQTLEDLRNRIAIRMGYGAQAYRLPPAKAAEIDDYLQEAQRFLFDKIASFRQSRYFKWPLVQGVRFYDFAENSDTCHRKFVPELVEWVGISYGDDEYDEVWTSLTKGIPPELYTGGIPESLPYRYDFRQCIELWPAPDERTGFLRIRAKFDLEPFDNDLDLSTIDGDLVFLLALANMKADRGDQSASLYNGMVQSRMGDICAGSHLTGRYIPGDIVWREPPEPRLVGGYLPSA